MKMDELTSAYLEKAKVRLEGLYFFRDRGAYSDVVRDAQSVVELALKAVLRAIGVEVPKVHDVGKTLEANADELPAEIAANLAAIKEISKRLRKERELSLSRGLYPDRGIRPRRCRKGHHRGKLRPGEGATGVANDRGLAEVACVRPYLQLPGRNRR